MSRTTVGARCIDGLLKKLKLSIENEGFVNKHRDNFASFTRERKLPFKKLILLLMSFFRTGLKVEIDRFYKSIAANKEDFETISKSAFSQARQKLRPEAFIELNQVQLEHFYQHAPGITYWNNYRIIGIDGSTLCLPYNNELQEHFGLIDEKTQKKMVIARIVMAFDVVNQLVVNAAITPYSVGEISTAFSFLAQFTPKDILIFDRGFPSYELIGALRDQGLHFCMRLPSHWKVAKRLMNSPENDIDWAAEYKPSGDNLKVTIDGLRVVKIPLENGEDEFLLTNLTDRETFSPDALKQLYAMRWMSEENYKFFKHACNIEYFTGKTVIAIQQDFYAKVFMMNLASIIGSQLEYDRIQKENKKINRKPAKNQRKQNRVQALAKIKDFLIELFYNKRLKAVLKQLEKLLAGCYEVIRPNRRNKRKITANRNLKTLSYKGL